MIEEKPLYERSTGSTTYSMGGNEFIENYRRNVGMEVYLGERRKPYATQ